MELNSVHKGDCLELMQGIEDKSIHMILCDLPYGTTACKWDEVIDTDILWQHYERIVKDDGAIVLTATQPFTSVLVTSNIKNFKYQWIWEKERTGNVFNCKNAPLKNYEDVLVFSKGSIANGSKNLMRYYPQGTVNVAINKSNDGKGSKGKTITERPSRQGMYVQTTANYPRQIIRFKTEVGLHPTQKPVALFEYLIKTYTNEGDTVLDNCAGSGTTAIACINTNRNYILMEKEESHFETILRRIKRHTPQLKLIA